MPRSFIVYEPLPAWTDPVTAHRTPHQFKATFDESLTLLRTEVDALSPGRYTETQIVLQVDTAERDVRRDGLLRADARVRSPGVVVSFDSKHGPLRYATDAFTDASWTRRMPGWQANVRAIALSLEALRRVDRYGVTRRGEQYTGWAALGSGMPMGPVAKMTRADAITTLAHFMHSPNELPSTWPNYPDLVERLYKRAAKQTHPDVGGDAELFKRVGQARTVLTTNP